jgi:hypothetical protein
MDLYGVYYPPHELPYLAITHRRINCWGINMGLFIMELDMGFWGFDIIF